MKEELQVLWWANVVGCLLMGVLLVVLLVFVDVSLVGIVVYVVDGDNGGVSVACLLNVGESECSGNKLQVNGK